MPAPAGNCPGLSRRVSRSRQRGRSCPRPPGCGCGNRRPEKTISVSETRGHDRRGPAAAVRSPGPRRPEAPAPLGARRRRGGAGGVEDCSETRGAFLLHWVSWGNRGLIPPVNRNPPTLGIPAPQAPEPRLSAVGAFLGRGPSGAVGASPTRLPPWRRCPCRLVRAAPPPGPRLRPQEFGECAGGGAAGAPRACRLLPGRSRCPRAGP